MDNSINNNDAQQEQHEHQSESNNRRVYISMAHVYEIDTVTKDKWLPKSKEAVPVSLVMDFRQKMFSLIASDPKQQEKTIMNSMISPRTVFTRTSLKFGQWSDNVANTVYGLGFATDVKLKEFVSNFEEFKKLLHNVMLSSSSNYSSHQQSQPQSHTGLQSASSSSWANTKAAQQHVYNVATGNTISNNVLSDMNQVCNDLASAHLGTPLNNNNSIQTQSQVNNNEQSQHTQRTVANLNSNINNIALETNGNSSMISDNGAVGPDISMDNNMTISHHRSQSLSGIRARMNSSSSTRSDQPEQNNNTIGHNAKQPSSHSARASITKASNSNNNSPLSSRESQLEYENERLKLALADINTEYNANKKKWQLEIQKLKTNIYKLTGALQESNNNRNEWEQLLAKLRSENAKYQIRILEYEASNGDSEARAMFQEKYDRISHELEKSQSELKKKDYEINVLQNNLEELEQKKNSTKADNDLSDISRQFEVVYSKIGLKVRELGEIYDEFGSLLETK